MAGKVAGAVTEGGTGGETASERGVQAGAGGCPPPEDEVANGTGRRVTGKPVPVGNGWLRTEV